MERTEKVIPDKSPKITPWVTLFSISNSGTSKATPEKAIIAIIIFILSIFSLKNKGSRKTVKTGKEE